MHRATPSQTAVAHEAQLPLWEDAAPPPAISLRHSRRARRVAVRVGVAGQVELVVPRGVAERQAWAFLESRAEWVRHHIARRRAALPPVEEFPPSLLRLPLLGENWRIFRAGGHGRARLVALPHPRRDAPGRQGPALAGVLELHGIGGSHDWRRCLVAWLKQRALPALQQRLDDQARQHGFTYNGVRVRLQRTRWGSCSAQGMISLNVALLFQPESVVRYLLCHELAHTRHMNHSARFWRCVAQCEPRWRELDAALLQGWRHVPHWLSGRE